MAEKKLSDKKINVYWREYRKLTTAGPVASKKVTKKVRSCLTCQKPFDSSWNGNRICDGCKTLHIFSAGRIAE